MIPVLYENMARHRLFSDGHSGTRKVYICQITTMLLSLVLVGVYLAFAVAQLCSSYGDIHIQVFECLIELQSWGCDDEPDQQHGFVRVNHRTYFNSVLNPFEQRYRGVNLFTLDPTTCTVHSFANIDTFLGQGDELATYLDSLAKGEIVLGVTADEPTAKLQPAIQTLVDVGVYVDDVPYGGKFAFIIHKGYPERTMMKKGFRGFKNLPLTVVPGVDCLVIIQSWGYEDNPDQQSGYFRLEGKFYYNSVLERSDKRFRGINVMTLDPETCEASSLINFDTNTGHGEELAAYIEKQSKGTILLGGTADEPTQHLKPALATLEAHGVSVGDVDFRGKFAFVMRIGFPRWSAVAKGNRGGNNVGICISPQGYPLIKLSAWGFDDIDRRIGYVRVRGKAYCSSNMSDPHIGVNLMTLDHHTMLPSNCVNFDTSVGHGKELATYIQNLTNATILVGITAGEPMAHLQPALQTLGDAGISVGDLDLRSKFAFIMVKGYPEKTRISKARSGGKKAELTVSTRNLESTAIHS